MLEGNVLISGGSGFLGRGILRRARDENWPCKITVLSRDEFKQAECRKKYPDARYVLGDILDEDLLRALMVGFDTVIHAAAMKYVPQGEYNVSTCITNNVLGTMRVLSCARWAGVENVVVISTDKAVQPLNVYGMTKALCERMVGESAEYGGTKVTGVRYGNVVGSTGSIIPVLLEQAQTVGTVTITDPDMTRFWIGVNEAIDLILAALDEYTWAGSILVPDPRAVRLEDLARAIAPHAKVSIVGRRQGEKTHEILLTAQESNWLRVPVVASYYELPALSQRRYSDKYETFTLSSDTAPKMRSEELMELIRNAADV